MSCDRMPSHFHSTIQSGLGPSDSDVGLERIGEVEWVGPAHVGVLDVGSQQPGEELRRGLPPSHQPVGDRAFGQSARGGQRALDQAGGGSDPKSAGDELVPDESLAAIELGPGLEHRAALDAFLLPTEGKQLLLDPMGQ